MGLDFQAPKLAMWLVLINNVNLYVLKSGKKSCELASLEGHAASKTSSRQPIFAKLTFQ